MVGRTISHYTILEHLGSGGMGDVYKAEDLKLGRQVALKFLASHLVSDPEIQKRFEREAKAAASLSHPNICHVYEIDQADGTSFLAMELVKGESLEARIGRGPLEIREAMEIGRQIADGLAEAHAGGVVHRDVKPGNILITPDGRVKILDFGLALLTEGSKLTKLDTTVGTVAYMSPEQAMGAEVDGRTDVWALGCVLYEMVAGERPFKGQYDQALLYEICHEAHEPLTGVRAGVPMELEFIVGKCLEKEATARYQTAGELGVDLKNLNEKLRSGRSTVLRSSTLAPETKPSTDVVPKRRFQIATAVAAAAVLGLLVAVFRPSPPPPATPVIEFDVLLPETSRTLSMGLSPDGRHLAVLSANGRLDVRSLDSAEVREIPVGEASAFAWSDDSREILLVVDGELQKMPANGGAPLTLSGPAAASMFVAPAWGRDGSIVFLDETGRIVRTPPGGGDPEVVVEAAEGYASERIGFQFLPDGRRFLYTESSLAPPDLAGIYIGSTTGETPRRLSPIVSRTAYVPSTSDANRGFLLYVEDQALVGRAFDAERGEIDGPAVLIASEVAPARLPDQWAFAASPSGVLAYETGYIRSPVQRAVWVGRDGSIEETGLNAAGLASLKLSPDGRRAAGLAFEGDNRDVWVYDLERGAGTRITTDPASDRYPAWSPDGKQIAFSSNRSGGVDVYIAGLDGAERLVQTTGVQREFLMDWSSDGNRLLFTVRAGPLAPADIAYYERAPGGDAWESQPYLETPFNLFDARLSPNGRYVAYVSNESGRDEIYVQSFPTPGQKTLISTGGGINPLWRRDGKELFYQDSDRNVFALDVRTDGDLSAGIPRKLFQLPADAPTLAPAWDVSADGRRFLVTLPQRNEDGKTPEEEPRKIRVVSNWMSRLEKQP